LERSEQGQVLLEGQDLTGVPAHRRGIVLMFQDYALFPHRTVAENIAFGLRMQKESSALTADRVAEVLALVGLEGFAERDVNELSGGERQRVALARSLAPHPHLLLLDEPLGALDRNLRERLLEELPVILKRVGLTAITVTHDQEEAFAMSDRVILLHDGRVIQTGHPEDVYGAPVNTWVAQFLGLNNLFSATVLAQQPPQVAAAFGKLVLGESLTLPAPDTQGTLLIHPWGIHLEPCEAERAKAEGAKMEHAKMEHAKTESGAESGAESGSRMGEGGEIGMLEANPADYSSPADSSSPNTAPNKFNARVARRTFHGRMYQLTLELPGGMLHLTCDAGKLQPSVGDIVTGWIAPGSLRWL
jgi:ABC-type Fe3+/spermidine/putrescine transport system ATPase subunit